MFKEPLGVELCKAEGFSRTEVCLPEGVDPWSPEGVAQLNKFGLHIGLADRQLRPPLQAAKMAGRVLCYGSCEGQLGRHDRGGGRWSRLLA